MRSILSNLLLVMGRGDLISGSPLKKHGEEVVVKLPSWGNVGHFPVGNLLISDISQRGATESEGKPWKTHFFSGKFTFLEVEFLMGKFLCHEMGRSYRKAAGKTVMLPDILAKKPRKTSLSNHHRKQFLMG